MERWRTLSYRRDSSLIEERLATSSVVASVFPRRKEEGPAGCRSQGRARAGLIFAPRFHFDGFAPMALYRVKPTRTDEAIAETISRHTGPGYEKAAELL